MRARRVQRVNGQALAAAERGGGPPDQILGADARRTHGGAQQGRARDEDAPGSAQHRQADGQACTDEGKQERVEVGEHASPVLVDGGRHLRTQQELRSRGSRGREERVSWALERG